MFSISSSSSDYYFKNSESSNIERKMKIAVIGAGASGLVAIKYCVQDGHDCEAFEQTEFIGGTWNYTDEIGLDKNGLPIHTSMYKNLRTNLPKELMMFENFPYPADIKESFILQHEVLQYLNEYAVKMKLREYIKFHKQVTNVEPIEGNKWRVEVKDVVSKIEETKVFDAVICCNGKYSVPYMPEIPGLDTFTGNCIHSHNYRKDDPYKDKTVLIIGGGPSGVDLCNRLKEVAKKVFLSLRSSPFSKMLEGILQKPSVEEIKKNIIKFKDGSSEEVDEIIVCTGYVYSYPFLSEKCRIIVDENYVRGLYKELICINYPTLIVMGIPGRICPFPTFDLQMKLVVKLFRGDLQLPSLEKMAEEMENERKSKDCSNRHFHDKGVEGEHKYWADLAELAKVEGIPDVFTKMHDFVIKNKRDIKQCFRIINEEEFDCYEI